MANDNDNIIVVNEKATYFKVKDIVATSKITIGSRGIAGDRATSAAIIDDKGRVLMLNDKGQGKVTKADEFIYAAKGSNGQVIAEGTNLVGARKDNYFIYDGSKNYYIKRNPAMKGKTAAGARVIAGKPIYLSR